MVSRDWFRELPEDFEESVRIDREGADHRREAIRSYHVTADSQRFISEFIGRTLGESGDMRTGANYWLYGYYGSGKSHLLTVLDGLMDTAWLEGQHDAVWADLRPEASAGTPAAELRSRWERVHDEYRVIPISINLLKYQGQQQRSFSEILLRHAHRNPLLTGVDDGISAGFSSQLDVAYFEDWYATTDAWPERQRDAAAVLEQVTPSTPKYDWPEEELWTDIQQYGALADVVLPELFAQETGTKDGYADLLPDDIDPEEAITRLEALRAECAAERDEKVKLVLLLDEVSLFIGTDFGRLTELQTIAENVDEVGEGEIQLVVTAQAKIEEVQPKFAARGADFTILKDRFPHRYQLPSKHVGDIAKRRLFQKSAAGASAVETVLDAATVKPPESLVYSDVRQNTQPPLNSIDAEELRECYPFLPYHAPLFLEILFNLRKEASDPAKSIFSGTARAILALMHGLLGRWIDDGNADRIVSLVDLYEIVEPELRDILEQDMRVIEGVDADDGVDGIEDEVAEGDLEAFDLRVAKAVLLLQNVHDIVPMNEGNLAVAVMDDLNGPSWISTANRVEESLDRLQKYIRPTDGENKPRYRFATQEERLIYEETEANERDPDWDAVVRALDDHLWQRVVQELDLPASSPYGDTGDEYPVTYRFEVDGTALDTLVERDGGVEIDIAVRGLHPNRDAAQTNASTLYWEIGTEGVSDLRKHLVEWWALRAAIESRDAPEPVERDLDDRANTVLRKLVSALAGGTYTVKDRTDITGIATAVETTVNSAYPDDFHPMMLQVDGDRLLELERLGAADPLPDWARKIQVPEVDQTGSAGRTSIQNNVMSLAGRQLVEEREGRSIRTVLDGIVREKPYYDEVRPALRAILWGFCRRERFLPIDEDGTTLQNDAVLDGSRSATTRLRLLEGDNLGQVLEEHGFKETTETVAEGLINLQEANERLHSKLSGLHEDVRLVMDTDVRTDAISALLESFRAELAERTRAAQSRIETGRSGGNGSADAIPETREQLDWFDDASDTWSRRLSDIYRWDAELSIGDDRFAWVDSSTRELIDARSESIAGYTGEWWTTDGWGNLVEGLEGNPTERLGEAWASFVAAHDLETLAARVESHPWILPATEIPAQVSRGFEDEYITPMRQFGRWYDTVDDAITTLAEDEGQAALAAASDVSSLDTLADVVDDIGALGARLDRLDVVVGDRTPDEVDRIGIVPTDRDDIDSHVARLVEDGTVDIEPTDSGVVLR
jgi:hypothetical protein